MSQSEKQLNDSPFVKVCLSPLFMENDYEGFKMRTEPTPAAEDKFKVWGKFDDGEELAMSADSSIVFNTGFGKEITKQEYEK